MHTLSPWTFAGVLGLILAASSSACSPSTNGYGIGGDDAAYGSESGDDGADLGGSETDTDNNDNDNGDGDDGGGGGGHAEFECEAPQVDGEVFIQLLGDAFEADDCSEPSFSARVAVASVGIYGLIACDCNEPICDGEKLELSIGLPDPSWMPQLEPGSCHHFRLYAEEVGPNVCRRNRVDIAASKLETPWYSTGSASEDLDHNGLVVTPVVSNACADACGEWQLRDVTFASKDSQQTLSWGQVAPVGGYEIVNWRSYLTPAGCGEPSADITAWTAR